MVEDRIRDGTRIAQLLSSEIAGREDPPYSRLEIVDANPGVEGTADGALAYEVEVDGERLASVFVHEDRAHVAFRRGLDAAVAAAENEGLRVRPKAVEPPQALVFVESGAQVKRALRVLAAAV